MGTFSQVNSLQLPYCPASREKDRLINEIGGMSGMNAEIYILEHKWSRQEGLIDKRIFAIVAGTGAGKSTAMIYGLYKSLLLRRRGKKSILCTQPRVSLAATQPYNVARLFKDMHVGEELGYLTGSGGKIYARSDKSVVYCTTRILENYLLSFDPDKFGSHYPIIVIDEAHDQSIEMLTALRTAQQYVAKYHNQPWCPLFIITSATIDPLAYISYFGADPSSPYNTAFIAGYKEHAIEERYLELDQIAKVDGDAQILAIEETCKMVDMIAREQRTHTDILVFWTSSKEIKRFFDSLKIELEKRFSNRISSIQIASSYAEEEEPIVGGSDTVAIEEKWHVLCLPYTRFEVTNRAQSYELTYREHRPLEIKIVGATNTIEVGATLPNLYVAIDFARQLTRVAFPLMGREEMLSIPISEPIRIQRKGRVGRTGDGLYIGLYDIETKEHMMPSSPPSTLIGTSIPSSIYTMLIAKTLAQFKEMNGDPLIVGKLLGLKRIGCQLPVTDIVKQIQLLTPISMDSCIYVMAKLASLSLIDWNGSLTLLGLQTMMYRNLSLGEMFLRARLMNEMIHPVEIELFCRTVSDSLSRAEVTSDVDWKSVVMRFYPHATITYKDKPPMREDVIGIFRIVLSCFEKITNGSLDFGPSQHPKWGFFNNGEAKGVIYGALDAYPLHDTEGAFYAPLFADMNENQRSHLLASCNHALREATDRLFGRKVDLSSEETETKVLS